eukprot:100952_1
MTQFNGEHKKAIIHYQCDYRKQMFPDITLNEILSLMVYANFTNLQYEFTKTYREKCGKDHTHFYHLGKYLKQAVHAYGTEIRNGNINEFVNDNVKGFYHGIGQKLQFPHIIGERGIGVKILCPLSTSSSFSVATNFTNANNGLIIEISTNWSKAKYFSVAWLSDYNEQEYV